MPSDVDVQVVDRTRLVWDTSPASILGQGSFGVVYLGAWDGTPVAIKVVKPSLRPGPRASPADSRRANAEASAIKQHRREIHRLSSIRNPCVIQYLGVFRHPRAADLYIVTEYLEGGSLHDSLRRMRARAAVLQPRSFLEIARQMASGLNHIHLEQYTHGDMKPQNILLTSPLDMSDHRVPGAFEARLLPAARVKIADFGLSKRLEGAPTSVLVNDITVATTAFDTGPCGTFLYMAPEAFSGVANLSDAEAKAADIYAYALILYELLTGCQSWSLERVVRPIQLIKLALEGKRPSWGDHRSRIDPDYVDLVERCWSQDSTARPTAKGIVAEINALKQSLNPNAEAAAAAAAAPTPPPSQLSSQNDDEPPLAHSSAMKSSADGSGHHESKVGHRDDGSSVTRPSVTREDNYGVRGVQPVFPKVLREEDVKSSTKEQQKDGIPIQPFPKYTAMSSSQTPSQPSPKAPEPPTLTLPTDTKPRQSSDTSKPAGYRDAAGDGETTEETTMPFSGEKLASLNIHESPKSHSPNSNENVKVGTEDARVCPPPSEKSEEQPGTPRKEEGQRLAKSIKNPQEQENAVDKPQSDDSVECGHGADMVQEIDASIIGGVQVRRVNSVFFPAPSLPPLQVPQDPDKRATMGTGSIAPNGVPPFSQKTRSGNDLLQSFLRSGNDELQPVSNVGSVQQPDRMDHGGNESPSGNAIKLVQKTAQGSSTSVRTSAREQKDIGWLDSTIEPIKDGTGHIHAVHDSPVIPELPAQFSKFGEMGQMHRPIDRAYPNQEVGGGPPLETLGKAPESMGMPFQAPSNAMRYSQIQQPGLTLPEENVLRPPRGVNSRTPTTPPDAILNFPRLGLDDTGMASRREMPRNELSSYQPGGTMTGHGATAPLLSETGYGAAGIPILQTPVLSRISGRPTGRQEHFTPDRHTVDAFAGNEACSRPPLEETEEVMHALQTPEAVKHLRMLWNRGCTRALADGLAQTRELKGEDILSLVCEFLGPSSKHDALVVKGLCTAIGNICRNAMKNVDGKTILQALRVIVSTLFAYRSTFADNEAGSIQVYTACNFALSNLLKVSNVIEDVELRSELARWILYVISWNVYDNGSRRGTRADLVSYEAICAARNFMWMNEANVQAFTKETGCEGVCLIDCLITSMRHFERKGSLPVLEACLSALVTAIIIPQHRKEFMELHGIAVVLHALQRHVDGVRRAKLGLAMITALFAMSSKDAEEKKILERVCVNDQVCPRLLQLLKGIQQRERCELEELETLRIGYGTLFRYMQLSEAFLESSAGEDAVEVISGMIEWLCMLNERGIPRQMGDNVLRAWNELCSEICAVVELLARKPQARVLLQKRISLYLMKMVSSHVGDETVTRGMQRVIKVLEMRVHGPVAAI